MITLCVPKLIFFFLLFFPSIRMSGKDINFDDKKITKTDFYKNEKVIKIDEIDVNKILVSKEEPYDSKYYLNPLLDAIMMILLDHYP